LQQEATIFAVKCTKSGCGGNKEEEENGNIFHVPRQTAAVSANLIFSSSSGGGSFVLLQHDLEKLVDFGGMDSGWYCC
jgi:hypothetical protein